MTTAQIDAPAVKKLLNNLAQNSAPDHAPSMFVGCHFDVVENGVVKLSAGEAGEASRLLDITGALSRENANAFRESGQFAIEDVNVDSLKTSLSAILLGKLTGRIWFPDHTPGAQGVDANQWSATETHSIRPMLRRTGIIKSDADLRVKDIEDGHSEVKGTFHWDQAKINTSAIDLDALQTTAEQMGKGRARRTN